MTAVGGTTHACESSCPLILRRLRQRRMHTCRPSAATSATGTAPTLRCCWPVLCPASTCSQVVYLLTLDDRKFPAALADGSEIARRSSVNAGRPKHEQHAEGKKTDGKKPKSNRQTPHSSPPGTPPGQVHKLLGAASSVSLVDGSDGTPAIRLGVESRKLQMSQHTRHLATIADFRLCRNNSVST